MNFCYAHFDFSFDKPEGTLEKSLVWIWKLSFFFLITSAYVALGAFHYKAQWYKLYRIFIHLSVHLNTHSTNIIACLLCARHCKFVLARDWIKLQTSSAYVLGFFFFFLYWELHACWVGALPLVLHPPQTFNFAFVIFRQSPGFCPGQHSWDERSCHCAWFMD
jgi:hypothetical protein